MTQNSPKDPLLHGLPKKFYAYETHYQTVIKLPIRAKVLAKSQKENHQAVRFKNNIWGVQFHPEFDKDIMEEYILHQKDELVKRGICKKKLLRDLRKCDISTQVLRNFEKITQKFS